MFIIRPIMKKDCDQLLELISKVGHGFTTLPPNKKIIAKKIEKSIESFTNQDFPLISRLYFFVMEDTLRSAIVGCSAILPVTGGEESFYSYKVSTLVQRNKELHIQKQLPILYLVNDYQDTTELCSLFLSEHYRSFNLGKLLSLSRFLFMAQYPEVFKEKIIAEIRGVVDDKGHSPFWHGLGKHFIDLEFTQADYFVGIGKRQFIADLMPKYPVYVDLLPEAARVAIGKPYYASQKALNLLNKQNFRYAQNVNIFDAGPIVECYLSEIAIIKNSKQVKIGSIEKDVHGEPYIIADFKQNFRAVEAVIKKDQEDSITIDKITAESLNLVIGDMVRIAALANVE